MRLGKTRREISVSETTKETAQNPRSLDELVRPGDRLIVSIRFLDSDEFGDEEITHQDIVLEDFLRSAESPDWDTRIVKIERSNRAIDGK
jgi:hypothetical protein